MDGDEDGARPLDGATPSTSAASSATLSPVDAKAEAAPDVEVYRMRFYNFNMANSSGFRTLAELEGPGGRGRFEAVLAEPLFDGRPADLAFATFVETRLALSEWLEERKRRRAHLDVVLAQNASKESSKKNNDWGVRGWVEGLASIYNGNLKTVLAFSSSMFAEDGSAQVFGRLPEIKVAGIAMPNPKKAFTGRTVQSRSGEGLRFLFVGAHFPIETLASALEASNPLQHAKMAFARSLRKVLRRAARRGLLDSRTILFLQGDLNSRTVLVPRDGEPAAVPAVADVLLEVLRDEALQVAIQHGLPMPAGVWKELVPHGDADALPVTYKFTEEVGRSFSQALRHDLALDLAAHMSRQGDNWGCPSGHSLTLGDVLAAATVGRLDGRGGPEPFAPESCDLYRRTLACVPPVTLQGWGVQFKESAFRAFRFPACADRVIYWAPIGLCARMSWQLPRGGYEVNHHQSGSDHRPVSLEAVLQVSPPLEGGAAYSFVGGSLSDTSFLAPQSFTGPPSMAMLNEVCQSDGDDSEPEVP